METNLYEFARIGDFDSIEEEVYSTEDLTEEEQWILLYQWSLIIQDLGYPAPDSNPETILTSDGGETLLDARFQVGSWYLLGKEGLPVDVEKGFLHLNKVHEQGISKALNLNEEIKSIRLQLEGDTLERFDLLFPL